MEDKQTYPGEPGNPVASMSLRSTFGCLAIRAAKRILSLDHSELRARVLMAEAVEQTALRSKPNQAEAVRAAQERRPPVFTDPSS